MKKTPEFMTQEQRDCTALLKLGEDGVWFCPKCGLRVLPPEPEEMLLAHARREGAALETLKQAFARIESLKLLLVRAADALEAKDIDYRKRLQLILDLRKAAQSEPMSQ